MRNAEHNQLLRCVPYCIARPTCPFSCSLIVVNDGNRHMIVTNRRIKHIRGNKICRPMREPIRSLLKKQFAYGGSVYREIKSEQASESLLSSNIDESISKLREKFQNDINADGKIPGAIQQICKYPCQIIVFTESSIHLFDILLGYKNVVLSWDASGSIIQEKNNSNRLLYYELSIALPGLVSEDSIVPITFIISDAHALVNVLHWLQVFKHSYSLVVVDFVH